MEVPDICFYNNRDWDPSYLCQLFTEDFYLLKDLWSKTCHVMELVEYSEKYCPVVEDISLDDETLCSAVEEIESQ